MASPSVTPASGTVREKVIRERNVPAAELAREASESMPDLFDYLETLTPEKWQDHVAYLYRDEPKQTNFPGAIPTFIDKYAGEIEIRPGYCVPMTDAGTIQQAIKEKFGGRVFRMIVKKGKQWITQGRFANEAPPKYPDANPQQFSGPLPNAGTQPTDASVASKAIDAMANQQPDAVRLAMDVLRSASEIVMRQTNSTPAQTASSLIDQTIMQSLINKALNPPAPPDPLETMLKYKGLFQAPQNETMDKIVTMALERLVNPPSAVSGRTTLLDLGREALPVLATTVRDAMTNWRMGVEAQRDAMAMQRGMNPGPGEPPPMNANPQPLPSATAAPAENAAAAPAQPAGMDPPLDWVEMKLAEIVKDLSFTVDQAVDEALGFLYRAYPKIVSALLDPPSIHPMLKAGEEGLLQLFQNRPMLQSVPVNPRLSEFIRKFVTAAKEAETERMLNGKPQPANAAPNAPPSA